MRLRITHETSYSYAPVVETAQHMAYLRPLSTANQTLLDHALRIEPTPEQVSRATDVFGNTRCFFSLQSPHTALNVTASSVVSTSTSSMPESEISWEKTRERFRYHSGDRFDTASEFVFGSPFVTRDPEFVAYAKPSFTPGSSMLAVAIDLMQRIHQDFVYESQSTEVNTPALQALAQRKGVCQDFAHIMIACMRSMGIPARYVSGYLLTLPAPGTVKLKGSDASHAWVSVYIPDFPQSNRWCDLDPTNNRCGWHSPGADYVTLARGRDFSDVSPMRGVIHGGASHILSVAVTVEPTEDASSIESHSNPVQLQLQIQSQSGGKSQGQSQGLNP